MPSLETVLTLNSVDLLSAKSCNILLRVISRILLQTWAKWLSFLKYIFINEIIGILIQIKLKFVGKGPINDMSSFGPFIWVLEFNEKVVIGAHFLPQCLHLFYDISMMVHYT